MFFIKIYNKSQKNNNCSYCQFYKTPPIKKQKISRGSPLFKNFKITRSNNLIIIWWLISKYKKTFHETTNTSSKLISMPILNSSKIHELITWPIIQISIPISETINLRSNHWDDKLTVFCILDADFKSGLKKRDDEVFTKSNLDA